MTNPEALSAHAFTLAEQAKVPVPRGFDEYGHYGENNPPLPPMKETP